MIAGMDSNNGLNHIGIGEREGRVYSNIVKKRNFNLVHGMGRSGDVNELQPKAVGSSLLVQLTCSLTLNLLNSLGMNFIKSLLVLPFATGMAITLSFLTLKALKPVRKIKKNLNLKYLFNF
jgi:O-phospho-L-seryl-tRNASec:L-selenocysteinyl-tRNA synthase